jgi:hypothetical protein
VATLLHLETEPKIALKFSQIVEFVASGIFEALMKGSFCQPECVRWTPKALI